jgi:hypothetical protein
MHQPVDDNDAFTYRPEADPDRCKVHPLNRSDVLFYDPVVESDEAWIACRDAPRLREWA